MERVRLDEASPEFAEIKKRWHEQAGEQTLETLPGFLRALTEDYEHDYGTICHAVAAGALGAAYAVNNSPQGGITGFQAGAVMWEFVRNWSYPENECGLRLVDFDNMLYPQYKGKFEKRISVGTWEALQEKARRLIAEDDAHAAEATRAHWESIAAGAVPFGYVIEEER